MQAHGQTIGERLRWARARTGLSQRELARKVGVDKQSIWKWETQGSIPLADMMPILAHALGVESEFLLEGKNPPASAEPAA